MTTLRFTKMQGLGNDFVVLDGIAQRVDLAPAQLKRLADRRYGVGCDQILVVEKPTRPDVDFRYRIWNADGVEVEQCGNGARCFVHFVRQRGLTDKRRIRVETAGGVIVPEIVEGGLVAVDMGVPRFAADDIPFAGDGDALVRPLDVDGGRVADHARVDGQSPCGAGRRRRRSRPGDRRRAADRARSAVSASA